MDTYLSAGTPVQLALPRLLAIGAQLRARVLDRVRQNRESLVRALGPGAPASLLPAEAGWSAIVRLPAVMTDEEWAIRLLDQESVLVQPGYFFDLEVGTTIVLSLLPDPATFTEATARLLRTMAAAI
jgi:aspartate/methionine/tyrosine aminotransferase